MGDKTGIGWTDATWSPVTGCTKIELRPERLYWPLKWRGSKQAKAEGRPSRIFVNSMSDLFHEEVPDDFIRAVFITMARAHKHCFQILTKRPYRMSELFRLWERKGLILREGHRAKLQNVWLGVSVENRETWEERSELLKNTPSFVRFISYEPALAPLGDLDLSGIHWIIAGGESGPHARPSHPDWFRTVRDQCHAAGVPFFFKQWGEYLPCGPIKDDPDFAGGRAFDSARGGRISVQMLGSRRFIKIGDQPMERVGKKRAGRLLDGREWNEFPKKEAR